MTDAGQHHTPGTRHESPDADSPGARLDDSAVRQRLARIDELLERVEDAAGPTARAAIETVGTLSEVYGEALARVLDGAAPRQAERMAGDHLLGHLMDLHGLRPGPQDRPAAEAVAGERSARPLAAP
ncbi:hypothetical protein ACF061_33310 [Streptomyces sp. NPDC015220]|uniref:hypothetical protein n=1 Tax=Streptomyces sp. NPDC015220 TaxID=3364947 RepID=UPI0036FE4B4A